MLPQAQERERTTRADKDALAARLAELLSRQGPGKYVLHVSDTRQVKAERLRTPLRLEYPQRVNGNGRA